VELEHERVNGVLHVVGQLPKLILPALHHLVRILKMLDKFNGIASVTLFRGDTCYLWQVLWSG
jgi:hypothetical protein